MLAFVAFLILTALCGTNSDPILSKLIEKNGRQKRLLFYDEQGHIVKSYGNSVYHFGPNEQENLFQWSFLNMFLSPIFPANLGRTAITYMVPVSDAVIQQFNRDPIYQNKLFVLTYKDPTVEVNPLCSGKRTQIPSPKLCNNFLNCWDGWAFEQECPADLVFSVEGYCDYPQNVDCSKRKLPERPDPTCKNDFQAFSSVTNCSEFFVCVNSIPVKFQCPADLAYSEHLGVCDYPYLVECNKSEGISKPASAPTTQVSTEAMVTSASSILPPSMFSTIPDPLNNDLNTNKLEYKMHSWTSTHVAVSRQDAIRQLKLEQVAQVKTKK